MQKILLIVVIIFYLIKININAQVNWVSLNGAENSAPQVNVSSSNNNNVSLTIKVNGFSVFDKLVDEESFQGLLIPDAENTMEEGLPQLPVITKLIAIPDCDDVSIQVITSNPFEYTDYNILPVPKLSKEGGEYTKEVHEKNKSFYQSGSQYPGKFGELIEVGYFRDQKVARIAIYPVQFNPADKKISGYTDFNITLSFINPKSSVNKELGIFRNVMHNACANYELNGISVSKNDSRNTLNKVTSGSVTRVTDLLALIGPSAIPVDYLIITHSNLYNSSVLTDLGNHRSSLNGYDIAICVVDSIYSKYPNPIDYISIRDFISAVYTNGKADNTLDGHLGYILLVGDAFLDDNTTTMVPAAMHYSSIYEKGGDYYYACTGGDTDDILDLMYGRIPVGNESELYNVVEKFLFMNLT